MTWATGDFNYNGTTDTADYNLLQANYLGTIYGPNEARVLQPIGQTIAALANGIYDGILGRYTDSNNPTAAASTVSYYLAAADFGDGNFVPCTVTADGNGGFTVSGTSPFALSDPNALITMDVGYASGSPYAGQLSALSTPITLVSQAITNLTATAVSTSEIDLAFNVAVSNATGIQVARSTDGTNFTTIATLDTTATTYADTGLSEGVHYYYQVTALPLSGTGASATADAWTSSLQDLTAVAPSVSEIDLGWTNSTTQATGAEVDRSADGTNFTLFATLAGSATSYKDTGLAEGSRYWYQVGAIEPGGPSYYVGPAYCTTLPIQTLIVTAVSTGEIDLTFGNISAQSGALIEVDRSTDGTNFTTLTSTLAAGSTSYNDTDAALVEGAHYWYRARALESPTPSGYTDPADTWTLPLAPSGLTAAVAGANEVDLSWENNSAGSPQTAILRSEDGVNFDTIDVVSAGTTTYADTSAADGTAYTYQVAATNPGGSSAASNSVPAQTPLLVPFSLTAGVFNSSEIDLSWSDGSATTATGYNVLRSTDDVNFAQVGTTTGVNASYFSDTSLLPGTHYYYEIQATNASTTSAASKPADGITDPTLTDSGPSSVAEGSTYTLMLTANHDPSIPDPVTGWDITWGDGSNQHLTGDPGSVGHIYSEPGSYPVVANSDGFTGLTSNQTAIVIETAANLAVSGSDSVNENTTYTLNATYTDPGGDHVKEWLITWGDGQTTDMPVSNPPTDTAGASTDTQSFTHQYAHGHATYTLGAQALTDDDLTTTSKSVQVINSDPNFNPGQDNNGPYEDGTYALNISPALDGGAHDPVTYDIQWGDGTTDTTCQGSSDGMSVPTQYHQYLEEGWRLVIVTPSYGSVQNKYVGTADSTPTIAAPPEQAVASGQAVTINASFTGGATSDQWATFIDLHDGTGPHAGTASGSSSGSLSFNLSSPVAPGSYQPTITLYDKGGTAAAVSTFTLDVWGAVIDKGEANDVLIASSDGTQNLQPVWFYFPHPAGVALNLTIGTTDATDDYLWSSASPVSGSTPTLGGSTSSYSFAEDASQSSAQFWVGAINGDDTLNVLRYQLSGQVSGTPPQLPAGTKPVPTSQPTVSNPASLLGVQIIANTNPNAGNIGDDVTDKSRAWLVGQMVQLTAKVSAWAVVPKGTKYHWTVPGTVLNAYEPTKTPPTVITLTGSGASGVNSSSISYFWVTTANGVAPDTISVSCAVSNITKKGETTFVVNEPTVATKPVNLNKPTISMQLDKKGDPHPALQAINPAAVIIDGVTVSNPAGFTRPGRWTFLQLVNSHDSIQHWNRSSVDSYGWSLNGSYVLDYGFPLPNNIATMDANLTKIASIAATGGFMNFGDSPAVVDLGQTQIATIRDTSFKTTGSTSVTVDEWARDDSYLLYIMYMPDGAGSQWVPLRVMKWSWAADAKATDTSDLEALASWKLVSVGQPTDSGWSPLTTVPTWKDMAQNGEWRNR